MIVSGVKCPECGDEIWSRSRHDFRWCSCEKTFVDGGREYLRYGGSAKIEVVKIDTSKK